ncbi:MAG: hypothetical protein B7Y41_07095 [Hydrogenophilales bacterium 28-61-23]|nr:MAG: hypothetical protein B7Y41_07095 [Hydrogenophilales bacterium 28-61-23]
MTQPWIHSARLDGAFILAPAFVITGLVLLLGERVEAIAETPPILWLLLIVGLDVGHVWSTIFRTYLDRNELRARQALYVLTPVLGLVLGVVLYRLGDMVFWRALAYLAAFHFVRQQFGFVMIYRRAEAADPAWAKRLDQALIYAASVYPLIAWHCQPRQFNWFVPGDFLAFDAPAAATGAGWLYAALIVAYVAKEARFALRRGWLNLPKNLIMLGTGVSWYVGILAFDNDLAFTATNVIAHGVPYLALIWIYGRNRQRLEAGRGDYLLPIRGLFRARALPLFAAALFIVAYIEEGLWDGLVWRDHAGLFPAFAHLPAIDNPTLLSWLVPLLALPQITHYLLDAFIWRMGGPDNPWKRTLFLHHE